MKIGEQHINSVHFIGIGGAGMSALASLFLSEGVQVTGYDRQASINTERLQKEGAQIHFEETPAHINSDLDLVIYTPAVPAIHEEIVAAEKADIKMMKRSEVLGEVSAQRHTVAVAGSHGKTTIAGMTAHLAERAGDGCTAILGGILSDYQSNFWSSKSEPLIVEADEFDRSFLHLHPNISLISSQDDDHLEVYGTREKMLEAYAEFAAKTDPEGILISKFGLPIQEQFGGKQFHYHLDNEQADLYLKSLTYVSGGSQFKTNRHEEEFFLPWPGTHNVENALAALAIAEQLNLDSADLAEAMRKFHGVYRRFEYLHRSPDRILIDDYAHHPKEIQTLIHSIKRVHPGKKITAIFQPHLFTRTRDLATGFALALSEAHQIILMPIYPAREEPISGVDSGLIRRALRELEYPGEIEIMDSSKLLSHIKDTDPELLVTIGAGDIDQLREPMREVFKNQNKKS
jgi:UDP-N-acetylmuramate--alanine ligase